MSAASAVAGLVLAHGRSRRFGVEKATALWRGEPLIAHVVAGLRRGCARVAVNAAEGSGAAAFAQAAGLTRLVDPPGLADGPLAGVLAGLAWLDEGAGEVLVTAPCDAPCLPAELALRLADALGARPAAFARAAGRAHPLCAAWRPAAAATLTHALSAGAHPPVRDVLAALGAGVADFDDAAAFANVNTRAELDAL